MNAADLMLTHRRAPRSSLRRAALCALTLAAVVLPTRLYAQAEALIRTSDGKVVGRVRLADVEAQRAPAGSQPRSGSPAELLDSAKVERSANRVRSLHVDVDTIRVRVGDQIGVPRAWAVDSAGYIIMDFVPLWSHSRGLTGVRNGRSVAISPGSFTANVRPMRFGPPRPTDPVATVVVMVAR